jgi:hypothetical protein
MRAIANASIDARQVEYLLARPGGLERNDPNGVIVVQELQDRLLALEAALQAQINQKVGEADIDNALVSVIKEFTLTGGVETRRVEPDDGGEYVYTTFEFATGFNSLNFRAFDLSETLDPFRKVGFLYNFEKFGVDSARVMFQSRDARFPDDQVSIALIRIPQRVAANPAFSLAAVSVAGNTPFVLSYPAAAVDRNIAFRNAANDGAFKYVALPANSTQVPLTAATFVTDSDMVAADLPITVYADIDGTRSQSITVNP